MRRILKQKVILLSLVFFLVLPCLVFAEISSPSERMQSVGQEEGPFKSTDEASVGDILATVIKAALSFLAIIFIIIIIINGYKWMMAGGNEDKVKTAQQAIKNAIIGLIIVIAAYSITYFVFDVLSVMGGGGGPSAPTTSG